MPNPCRSSGQLSRTESHYEQWHGSVLKGCYLTPSSIVKIRDVGPVSQWTYTRQITDLISPESYTMLESFGYWNLLNHVVQLATSSCLNPSSGRILGINLSSWLSRDSARRARASSRDIHAHASWRKGIDRRQGMVLVLLKGQAAENPTQSHNVHDLLLSSTQRSNMPRKS